MRYWDGTQWTGGPMAPPPGAVGPRPDDPSRFATVGIRIGAALLDLLFVLVVAIVLIIPIVAIGGADSTGDALTTNGANFWGFVVTLLALAVQVWLLHTFGGTPGKLVLGLRITEADGTTTPPSWQTAAMRVIPIAIATSIPFVGGLIGFAVLIMCLVWVSNDPERRSVYDRVGNTRVVYANRL
ncbi:MAG: RDD family protein [Acidimicrobiales bacterium]